MKKDRTKIMFAEAMFELARTKPIEKITVQDLLDQCNAARQSFYNHFKDKYDLIRWIFATTADSIMQNYLTGGSLFHCYYSFYLYLSQHKAFFVKAVKLTGQNSFLHALYEHTHQYFTNFISEHFGAEALTESVRFSISFNSYGAVNMCREWIENGMTLSEEELTCLILNNMPPELKQFFPETRVSSASEECTRAQDIHDIP